MKLKRIFGVIFIFISINSNVIAQKKDIRIDFGFHGNLPERLFKDNIEVYNNKNGGYGIQLFPNWNYNDNINLGLNLEYSTLEADNQSDIIWSYDILSFSPTMHYYFTDFKVRPFVGLGIGAYHVINNIHEINIGFSPSIGISIYDVFKLSLNYNKILGEIQPFNGEFGNYYLSMKGSVSIGLINTKKDY